jgi:serine/threonine protein kinase
MSPEQTRGEPLDEKSDVFLLGSVLYEAATGTLAFQGDSHLAVMHTIASATPAAPSQLNRELSPAIDHAIAKALAKDKNERYASAGQMAEAFEALESAATGLPAQDSVSKKVRRSRWLVAAVSAVLLIAGAAVARYWARPRRHTPNPEAYTSLGITAMSYYWDYPLAERRL